jgi:ubiquinone/menaquinone biosynthesis C-methylase UbiE
MDRSKLMKSKNVKEVAETWEDIWKKAKFEEWDKLSENVYQILCKETFRMQKKLLLEAGSGTGRISCKLKEDARGDVVLLDVSKAAIKTSKKLFEEKSQMGFFILGSILSIPLMDDIIDVAWNAGVLEHFSESEQILALKEMSRVCKNRGVVITLNPFSRALLYRIGKWFAEKTNAWTYGYEKPMKSCRIFDIKGYECVSEYSIDFDTTINFLSYVPVLNHFVSILRRFSQRLPARVLSQYGYLIVSIARKHNSR